MKLPVGASFSMSAFPVRLTPQSFSLLPAHPGPADGLWNPLRDGRTVRSRCARRVELSKLLDSMKVEHLSPSFRGPFDQSEPHCLE